MGVGLFACFSPARPSRVEGSPAPAPAPAAREASRAEFPGRARSARDAYEPAPRASPPYPCRPRVRARRATATPDAGAPPPRREHAHSLGRPRAGPAARTRPVTTVRKVSSGRRPARLERAVGRKSKG